MHANRITRRSRRLASSAVIAVAIMALTATASDAAQRPSRLAGGSRAARFIPPRRSAHIPLPATADETLVHRIAPTLFYYQHLSNCRRNFGPNQCNIIRRGRAGDVSWGVLRSVDPSWPAKFVVTVEAHGADYLVLWGEYRETPTSYVNVRTEDMDGDGLQEIVVEAVGTVHGRPATWYDVIDVEPTGLPKIVASRHVDGDAEVTQSGVVERAPDKTVSARVYKLRGTWYVL
jgi:hypothetical protein